MLCYMHGSKLGEFTQQFRRINIAGYETEVKVRKRARLNTNAILNFYENHFCIEVVRKECDPAAVTCCNPSYIHSPTYLFEQ